MFRAHSENTADPVSELDRLRAENEQLANKNQKLERINQVLMRRVELGWGNHSDAYQSFENAALLADRVKNDTIKLKQTMGRLEAANKEVTRAQKESELARQRLVDSVESIFDAFALFDDKRRMILANGRFFELWSHTDLTIEIGKTLLSDLVQYSREKEIFKLEKLRPLARSEPSQSFGNRIYQLQNERWLQTSESETADGGLVLTCTDITRLKNSETRQRERALEQQARILESTINNMSQGVTLIDDNCRLLVWNSRFLEISKLDDSVVQSGVDFHQLMSSNELYVGPDWFPTGNQFNVSKNIQEREKVVSDGRVILIRRHLIPSGGFVNTYTDITERSLQQAALSEGEKRIRLITDAVPALISYIDSEVKYQFANLQFEEWYATSRRKVIGKAMIEVLGAEAFAKHEEYVQQALQGQTVEFEIEENNASRSQRISQKTYVPHYDGNNQVIGFFALEQDVTKQRRTRQALKAAYDNLEERVYQRTKQITEINNKLRDEILERRQVEASLLNAKREAEEANISKIKFLAATSHDLLQPLNAACLFASSLKEKNLPQDTHHLVQSLSYSLENIESLISSLVDISKLDAGVVEPEPGVFDVSNLLDNLANEFQQQNKNTAVEFHYLRSQVSVYSDSQLLARILRNFLTNAFRYTEKGRIVLGARRRHQGLEIQVIDTGPGIAAEDLDLVFQEFHRGEHSSREDRGLGLGLAIVDKIGRILNHTILVTSIQGQGSCFSVLIPYASEIVQPLAKAEMISEQPIELPAKRNHVLVIDNDEAICMGMQTLLEGWGCEVDTLQRNPQIEALIENGFDSVPDLIIADYHLDNGLSGLDVVQRINQRQPSGIPVLLITANYTSELRQQTRELGYLLINKPVKPVKLKLAINHLLQL